MEATLIQKIQEIFHLLSNDPLLKKYLNEYGNVELKAGNQTILKLENSTIISPVDNIEEKLDAHKSPLKESFHDINKVKQLIEEISKAKAFVRLNHLGFCYKVNSIEEERERLKKILKEADLHLYEEWSDNNGAWLFYGNVGNWQDPLIELVPIVKTEDKWQDYWIPHIQIDIDTTLSQNEIENYVNQVFGKDLEPFPIVIGGVIYIMRMRLGIINGVNVDLDFATNNRQVQFHRRKLLKVLI